MLRSVLHLDIAAFGIAVERVVDPALPDRPVVVAPAGTSRAVVVTASLEARLWRIHRGMLLETAATNKLLSRVAAKIMRPDGLCDVFPGGEGQVRRRAR